MSRKKLQEQQVASEADRSRLEQELADALQDRTADSSAIRALMEHMSSLEKPSRAYVTSYPACNSDA